MLGCTCHPPCPKCAHLSAWATWVTDCCCNPLHRPSWGVGMLLRGGECTLVDLVPHSCALVPSTYCCERSWVRGTQDMCIQRPVQEYCQWVSDTKHLLPCIRFVWPVINRWAWVHRRVSLAHATSFTALQYTSPPQMPAPGIMFMLRSRSSCRDIMPYTMRTQTWWLLTSPLPFTRLCLRDPV